MNFIQIYHFLFETYEGIGCMIVACLVITTVIAAALERRTRKAFKDRGDAQDWKFDEDDEKEDDR